MSKPRSSATDLVESTSELVDRARKGEREALERLFARQLPALRRWARGRLPRRFRDLEDTEDLVQDTAIRVMDRISTFVSRHPGALQAYLRQAVVNRIRDEIRRSGRSPNMTELNDDEKHAGASPLDEAIGSEAVERYERALARLRAEDREVLIARVEMENSYEEIAQLFGRPSADAARMAVHRALVRLAEEMKRGG
jgi:RNA polymerase sigma-70 factor (ECF subfamily)